MKRTPLKRSPMRRKVKSTSYARRERGVEYMGWVRTQPCAIYAVGVPRADRVLLLALPCSGPVQADHAGVRIAGFGTKSRDRDCIAFFALVWRPLYRYRGPYDAWMHRVHGPIGCGYVPCPRCMNRPIIVRDCDDRCGHVAEQWELTSMVEGAS